MKPFVAAVFVGAGTLLTAEPLQRVLERRIEAPRLSLGTTAHEPGAGLRMGNAGVSEVVFRALPSASNRSLFRMPIVVPPGDLDPQFLVRPDPSPDFKLLVINPDRVAAD